MKIANKAGAVIAAISALALLTTTSVQAQTPETVYKNMFGGDCVDDYVQPDPEDSTYIHIDFVNTCNMNFTVTWYVRDVFRGTLFVKAFKTEQGVLLRKDAPDMKWKFEP